MPIHITSKDQQAHGEFNHGAIKENKPIGFPQDGAGQRAYSNLVYWAHAWTGSGESTIELHPHKGFEILSFVLQGNIEHYDTKLKQWQSLARGDVQIIRAGSGISHSEKMLGESAMFQIWFDPDLNKSIGIPASYSDYPAADFPVNSVDGMTTTVYRGPGSPLEMESEGVGIRTVAFEAGTYSLPVGQETVFSAYLLDGAVSLDGEALQVHDFAIVREQQTLDVTASVGSRLFVIKSPIRPSYATFADRFRMNSPSQ